MHKTDHIYTQNEDNMHTTFSAQSTLKQKKGTFLPLDDEKIRSLSNIRRRKEDEGFWVQAYLLSRKHLIMTSDETDLHLPLLIISRTRKSMLEMKKGFTHQLKTFLTV